MNTSIMIRYFSVILILLSVIVSITDSFINSMTTMSLVNSRKKNIVRNKKDIPYRKFSNENEKYLYGNYLVSLRKFKRAINYSKLFKLSIIYENNDFIIINKWTGIATQGGSKINISIDDIISNF